MPKLRRSLAAVLLDLEEPEGCVPPSPVTGRRGCFPDSPAPDEEGCYPSTPRPRDLLAQLSREDRLLG